MKKVILIDASPREGANCSMAVDFIAENIKDAEVEIFRLREKKLGPCLACNECKKLDKAACVQQDDLGDLVKRIDEMDGIVVAAPIYFGMVNAPAKALLDRLYCFFAPAKEVPTLSTKLDKKAALVLAAGSGPADVYAVHGEAYIGGFSVVGAKETKVLSFNGGNLPGEIWKKEENLAQLKELSDWLLKDAE